MARNRTEIKLEMTTAFMANETLAVIYGFSVGALFSNEFSIVSFENKMFDIFSYFWFLFEQLLDTHKTEIDTAILQQKSGTPNWYKNKALAFQFGYNLIFDSDLYDNSALTIEEIEASKIVKYCSVKESQDSNRLVIKVAAESGDELKPLEGSEKESFEAYMLEIKYAGVKLSIVNNPADKLVLNMLVYRNVLVLDENGTSILNGDKPVEKAIRDYMKSLPFNGELVINDLIGYLKLVPGVDNVHINSASSSAYDVVTDAYLGFIGIYVKTIPSAGYFEIENFDTVSYVV